MAETTNTSTDSTRSAAAEKAAATRKKNAAKRSTAAKKAAQTRAANRGSQARTTTARKTKATAKRTRTTAAQETAQAKRTAKSGIARAGEIAEKAVFVPVGAALVTRDLVGAAVEDLRMTYSTRKKTENELKRFERRGASALKSIERDVRARTEPVRKNTEFVGARVENVVQGAITTATKATTTVQERIASIA